MDILRNIKAENEVSDRLKNLVGIRFNKKMLEEKLTEIFGKKVILEDISKEDDDLADFNFLGEFNIPKKELYGYFDIYYLKMRRPGFDGADFYITEIAIEFE